MKFTYRKTDATVGKKWYRTAKRYVTANGSFMVQIDGPAN